MILTATTTAAGGFLAWWHWRGPLWGTLAIVAGLLWVVAVGAPRAYAPLFDRLERGVRALVRGFSWLLLACVFVLVFIPGGWVLKLRRRDPLRLRRQTAATQASYWHQIGPRDHAVTDFRRQF